MKNNIPKYIALDLETGGLWNDVSLLTAYFAVLNEDFNIIDELDLKLIPDDGIYKVEPEGMAVNKINLVELAKEGIPYKKAKTILYDFLKNNYNGELLTPIGQGILGDVRKLCDTIISKGSWDNFVSRRGLDTMYIARYLQEIGKMPKDISISLENLISYFDIKIDGELHCAKVDALGSVKVLQKMIVL